MHLPHNDLPLNVLLTVTDVGSSDSVPVRGITGVRPVQRLPLAIELDIDGLGQMISMSLRRSGVSAAGT